MKAKLLRLVCCCAAAAMLLCGCGKEPTGNEFNNNPNANNPQVTQSQQQTLTLGSGFDHGHAVEAGFGMGTDTADDIIARLSAVAQPLSVETAEYSTMTITTVEYSFGVFEFQSTDGTTPVLTYADIAGTIAGPCGVQVGDMITDAAEVLYTGTGASVAVSDLQEIWFYGQSDVIPRGRFFMLTAEFTSSTTPELYALEYLDDAYDGSHFTRFTMYFGEQSTLVRYTLRYETLS